MSSSTSSSFLPPPPPPPVPPRPQSAAAAAAAPGPPPPLPPLPPGYASPPQQQQQYLQYQQQPPPNFSQQPPPTQNYGTPPTLQINTPPPWANPSWGEQRPHTETPIPAPRPHKVDYEVAGNMAKNLDENLYSNSAPYPPQQQTQQQQQPPPMVSSPLSYHASPYPPQGINYTPGFVIPTPSPAPPPPNPYTNPATQQHDWLGWNPNPTPGTSTPTSPYPGSMGVASTTTAGAPLPYPGGSGPSSPYPGTPGASSGIDEVNRRMSTLAFSPPPPKQQPTLTPAQQLAHHTRENTLQSVQEKAEVGGTVPIPTIPSLTSALPSVERPTHEPSLKLVWCRDVFWLVNQHQALAGSDADMGGVVGKEKSIEIRDPQLLRLFASAVGMITYLTSSNPPSPTPSWYAEALYHKASLLSTPSLPPSIISTYPHIKFNPRSAFRDFESSARMGFARSWFKLGRDYESFNDFEHAKECFERGVRLNEGRSLYRMGIAFLLGQLGVERDVDKGLSLMQRAADKSDLEAPEGGYVWALLLLGEFTPLTIPIPPSAFLPYLPPSITRPNGSSGSPGSLQTLLNIASKPPLLISASLHFAPAQYKLGHAYEFAQPSPPFQYDPLLSVEWYSKASQGGEVEADMALSKWFLCGAPPEPGTTTTTGGGGFEKDENLAYTFAERAAKKGLATAMFALGYYSEVGIGPQGTNIPLAIEWYRRAAKGGNEDARGRLEKLEREGEGARMGREEHEGHVEGKLVRRRTQAKERSERLQQQQGGVGFPQQGAYPPTQQQQQQGPPGRNKLRKDGKEVVENVRRGTLEYVPEVAEPGGSYFPPTVAPLNPYRVDGPGGGIPPRGRYASSAHASSLPPQAPPGAAQGKPPYPTPNHRYSLADNPPPGGGALGRRTQSPSRLPVPNPTSNSAPNSRPTSSAGSHATSSTAVSSPSIESSSAPPGQFKPAKAHYPATFAEMGIQGARAEDKDCVVM